MNNNSYRQPEMEINLKEVIWDLLEQWKAILIVAFLMALLVCGAKHYKDMKAYSAGVAAAEKMAESGMSAEDRIAEIVESLGEEDREIVEFIVEQNEWIDTETEYVNNSILLNSNPTNQRTLNLSYIIETPVADDSSVMPLLYDYSQYLKGQKMVDNLRKVLDSDADDRYIVELISGTGNSGTGNSGTSNKAAFGVAVVLPEDADAAEIENAVTSALNEHASELKSAAGSHSLRLLSSREAYLYNNAAVDKRTNLMYNINNLKNNAKNMQSALSDEQKSAIDSITAIKQEEAAEMDKANTAVKNPKTEGADAGSDAKEPAAPGWSKKYALLGFILGCFAYAAIYLVWLIMRGRVNYASDLESLTGVRLIGEVYELKEHRSLLQKLLHSSAAEKIQRKRKMSSDNQIDRLMSTLTAICEHEGLRELTILNVVGNVETSILCQKVMKNIVSTLKKHDVRMVFIDIGEDIDERSISAAESAVILASRDTSNRILWDVMTLCNTYGTKLHGSIFVSKNS